jgi:hypothetical protein
MFVIVTVGEMFRTTVVGTCLSESLALLARYNNNITLTPVPPEGGDRIQSPKRYVF